MGLGSYFKADRPDANPSPTQGSSMARRNQSSAMSEKQPGSVAGNDMELQPPTPKFHSRPQSISGRSVRSNGSSMFIDEIKHEVMVNYLYQQQCSQLWVSDGSGEVEGVLLRKTRGHYMACPPQLGNSSFAMACAALNVQVRSTTPLPHHLLNCASLTSTSAP
jgi:hypothetical protein